jgi:CheY-like chemotaxis protein
VAIALSGYGMEDDLRRSREAGFAVHLTKPISFEAVETTLRRLTDGAG